MHDSMITSYPYLWCILSGSEGPCLLAVHRTSQLFGQPGIDDDDDGDTVANLKWDERWDENDDEYGDTWAMICNVLSNIIKIRNIIFVTSDQITLVLASLAPGNFSSNSFEKSISNLGSIDFLAEITRYMLRYLC